MTDRDPSLALLLSLSCLSMPAAALRPLFDTHLHYDAAHAQQHDPAAVLAILDRQRVIRAVIIGSPPEQATNLYARAPDRIVPFLGAYREPGDKVDWWQDADLPERMARQLDQGRWSGIGELHLFAEGRHSPVFLRIVDLASDRHLPLLMHADPAVIDALFEHAPGATVIWAHAGAYPYPPLLADYLQRYPRLYVDLSVRDGRIAPDGVLDDEWQSLLMANADRFLVGVDTYRSQRWARYGEVAAQIRGWLDQLPEAVATQIASGNAERLFGPAPGPTDAGQAPAE